MDPLFIITSRTLELATYARNAFAAGQPSLSCEYLGECYALLDEVIGSEARQSSNGMLDVERPVDLDVLNSDPEKCESNETTKRENHEP